MTLIPMVGVGIGGLYQESIRLKLVDRNHNLLSYFLNKKYC